MILPDCDKKHIMSFLSQSGKISWGDEIAHVNFFYDDIFNHFYAARPENTVFGEITQNKRHYAVQGNSRSPILAPIESSYTISYYR